MNRMKDDLQDRDANFLKTFMQMDVRVCSENEL